VYIGDAQRDIEAGRRAGMHTLAARFGYLRPDDNPDDWGADKVIEWPQDIIDWLRNHD
jgi:phosphoglycolate phosphatase